MDRDSGDFYFIEVNPRVQVEHTVTEEVTGIDIVRAQILIAEGTTLAEATGKASQAEVMLNGHAIQCRITTEDPQNNFIPDYGRITAYRGATGHGIRLDGGTAYSGAVITRYYDSLLEKVTAWAPTPEMAIARLDRALREFRIRGVSTNIAFVENLLKHPTFLDYSYTTKFIDTTPELFHFSARRDRATKILTYVADITVNGHPETAGRPKPPAEARAPKPPVVPLDAPPPGTRQLLEEKGAKAVADWMLAQEKLLVTDTTMRDGHQSLLATRMRSFDMIAVAPAYAQMLPQLFSVECWGGATFDVAYRFLQECPWQRLRDLRARMPNLMTQMLLRASNGVGYTNYPDNVVQTFVAQAAKSGVDVFRVFDSLNWVENMRVAMDAVIESGKICEAAICYTGDLLDPARSKYDLKYYVGDGEGAARRRGACAGAEGHGGAAEAVGGLHAGQDAEGGGRAADPLPHPRHQRGVGGEHPGGVAGRGGCGRRGDGQLLGQYLAALPGVDRRGGAADRARHRARHRGDPADLRLLGGGAQRSMRPSRRG